VISQTRQGENQSLVREPFSFLSDDQKTIIHGEVVLPNTSQIRNCPVVIFVQPPAIPIDKDYHGLFKTLADYYEEKGIISLRFENRSMANNSLYKKDFFTSTMEAEDIYRAIVAIKKDRRFKELKIGLLGHSEGTNAILEEIHKHGQPAFVVLLSPMGLNGNDFTFYQMKNALLRFTHNNIDSTVTLFLRRVKEILAIEYKNKNNVDTLNVKFKSYIMKWYADNAFGKLTFEEAFRRMKRDYLNPRLLAYVQFDPVLYYSSLCCPALILYGKEDDRLDYESNSRNIDSLFKVNNKTNYKIVSFESLNHNFKNINDTKVVDEKAMDFIITWIKSLQ